jgi:hypothetical protein
MLSVVVRPSNRSVAFCDCTLPAAGVRSGRRRTPYTTSGRSKPIPGPSAPSGYSLQSFGHPETPSLSHNPRVALAAYQGATRGHNTSKEHRPHLHCHLLKTTQRNKTSANIHLTTSWQLLQGRFSSCSLLWLPLLAASSGMLQHQKHVNSPCGSEATPTDSFVPSSSSLTGLRHQDLMQLWRREAALSTRARRGSSAGA